MNEHILVKMGLDKGAYDSGLDGVNKKVGQLRQNISQIGNIMRAFGLAVIVRQLVKSFEDLRDAVNEQPDLFSPETIASVEKLQIDLEMTKERYRQLKVSALELYLLQKLPSAKDSGLQAVYESQETQRLRITLLEDTLKKKQEQRSKVEKELEKLTRARERAETKIRDLMMERLTPEQRLVVMKREQAEIVDELSRSESNTVENYELQESLAAKSLEIIKTIQEIEVDRTKEQETQLKLLKEQAEQARKIADSAEQLAAAHRAESTALADRSRMDVSGAANAPAFNRYAAHARALAQQVMMLEEMSKLARLHGAGSMADRMTDRALQLRQKLEPVLTSAEADPMQAVKAATAKAADELARIREQATTSGLIVQPRNGQ